MARARAKGVLLTASAQEVLAREAGVIGGTEPAAEKSLLQFFRESPLVGLELKFERDKDTGREVFL